jgi:6-phosphogluconolactonase
MEMIQSDRASAIEVHADAAAAARAVAERFASLAVDGVETRGRFTVALTGGGSPRAAYRLLGEEPFASRIPWEHVHLFWGDERCVPPHHARSNYRMAHDAFIARVPIPRGNVHRMMGEVRPVDGASAYAEALARVFDVGVPIFDLVHLGVGHDGHVCSLFPFDALLMERVRNLGVAIHQPLGEPRISLTIPVLNAARRVEMIVTGREKAAVVRQVLRGPLDPFRIPAQLVRPVDGVLAWTLDRDAASALADGG